MTDDEDIGSENMEPKTHSCSQCQKSLNPFNYFSLRKYEKCDDEEFLKESFDFCSTDCFKKILERGESHSGFMFYEISRCVGYYDCERLDNLRRMCESKKQKSFNNNPLFSLSNLVMAPVCSPAEVGIIKSNIKLLDLIDKFDKVSTKISEEMLAHTKQMTTLTWIVLIVSILNLILLFYQIFGSLILGVLFVAK